jgi:hypothetical protein
VNETSIILGDARALVFERPADLNFAVAHSEAVPDHKMIADVFEPALFVLVTEGFHASASSCAVVPDYPANATQGNHDSPALSDSNRYR